MLLDLLPSLRARGWLLTLASASPRRIDILRSAGLGELVEVSPSTWPEALDPSTFPSAGAYAAVNARAKALDVARSKSAGEGSWSAVLGCDSVVAVGGCVLEKPLDSGHAARMLARLSGGESAVVTACALVLRRAPTAAAAVALGATRVELSEGGCEATVIEWQETTTVRFAVLPQALIDAYVAQESAWAGKAGGYGIQDIAASFIEGIHGDYYNVMGLPLASLCGRLRMVLQDRGGGCALSLSRAAEGK